MLRNSAGALGAALESRGKTGRLGVIDDNDAKQGGAAECDDATCESRDRESGRQMESGERNSHLYSLVIPATGSEVVTTC